MRFKQFVKELYTIGHTRSYDASANRAKSNLKHGSKDPLDKMYGQKVGSSKGQYGGAAFKTVKSATQGAKELKKDFPGRKYSVYKMKGDFDKDTYYSSKTGGHHIKRDTEITHKVVHNASEHFVKEAESWEAGYKRRVVKTTDPEHKEKGYNWRIKGKKRPEISIRLYKEKPSQSEFNKQMKRVAGHEFGG